MKLSNNTVKILKNYSTINSNMVFTEGNVLRTISAAGNILSIAEIEEQIPFGFAIYDLSTLLAMISCMDNYEINFKENNLEIVSDKGLFEIYYCFEGEGDEIIKHPPKQANPIDNIYEFKVTSEDFQFIMKSISVTSARYLTIRCDGKDVIIDANDRKNLASNSYRKKIGEFDSKFDVFCSVDTLKFLPNDYNVSISVTKNKRSPLLHFYTDDKKIQYWVACESGSKL